MRCVMRRVQISSYVVWAWMGVGCLIFPSCGPSIESIVEQYRGAVAERLAQVSAVSKLVADAGVDGGIGFDGVALDFHQTDQFVLNPSCNTGVIHIERLKDLTGYDDKLGMVIAESYFLSNAQSSLDGGWWVMGDEASSVEAALQRASQIRYLFVIRKIEHKLPRSLEGQDFRGGQVSG